jgi:pantoate--beta-alanine ligase
MQRLDRKRRKTLRSAASEPGRRVAIKIIEHIAEMQSMAETLRCGGHRIGFVPTMGFLHEGHLSLMRIAREVTDRLVVSIFVNPAQFGPNEDYGTYPRDLNRDLELCRREQADVVFTPTAEALYPEGYQTYVSLEHLPQHLCGLSRPVFFTGVATVVTKLFHIVKPHVAVFGEKDYQQLLVIRRMVRDMNLDIEILGGPIVRESDGLAMSSRNAYLTPELRETALGLSRSLQHAAALVSQGIQKTETIRREAEAILTDPDTQIDYISICDPESLVEIERIDAPALMALAVKVGNTRLIDNAILKPASKPAESR